MITSAIPPSALAIPQVPSSFVALHLLLPFPDSPPVCSPLWLWWQMPWAVVTFGERIDCHCRSPWMNCDPIRSHLGFMCVPVPEPLLLCLGRGHSGSYCIQFLEILLFAVGTHPCLLPNSLVLCPCHLL